MIKQQSIEEVQNLDIVEVIGKNITLTNKGTNYQGSCPFHEEKTPSFSVSPSRGIFKCFGCGKAGNAISFVMEFKKLDYISAVKIIAADHNTDLRQEKDSNENDEKHNSSEQLYFANKFAYSWFQANLKSKENITALLYVQSRWSDEMIVDFGIGFAPDRWDGLKNWAKENGLKEDTLFETGLLTESKGKRFDYFRNRTIIPIFNTGGWIV